MRRAVFRGEHAAARQIAALLLAAAWAAPGSAQTMSQKGFAEVRSTAYPQRAANDTTRLVGEMLLRYEAVVTPVQWLRLAGAFDLRGDTHDQTDASWAPDWEDRGPQRPRIGVRRLSIVANHGPLTVEVGRQFIRWGKADVLNPTDRFAPRDFLNVFDSDFLAVTGARAIVEGRSDTLDVVWVPRFTPSRLPLEAQRWAAAGAPAGFSVLDAGRLLPDARQVGARWSRLGRGFEFSVAGYRGVNHLPAFEAGLDPAAPLPTVRVARFFPAIWMVGADAAVPLSPFTLKGEAAFFGSRDSRVDEYWLYVVQVERQAGEWLFVGGYAGEAVTAKRQAASFAPDRGLTKALIGRASLTIDTNRSVAVEGALRQNLDGSWVRLEYSQASGQHLRCTVQGSWLRGEPGDFFGRFARNSNITATIRYSY